MPKDGGGVGAEREGPAGWIAAGSLMGDQGEGVRVALSLRDRAERKHPDEPSGCVGSQPAAGQHEIRPGTQHPGPVSESQIGEPGGGPPECHAEYREGGRKSWRHGIYLEVLMR
jgi:hypothetical protein